MIEATNVMLVITILLSVWAYFAWNGVSKARSLRLLDGRTVVVPGEALVAKQLLVVIVFVDAMAAVFAAVAWSTSV